MLVIKRSLLLLLLAGTPLAVQAQDHWPDYMRMARQAFDAQKYDLAIGHYESALDDRNDYWAAYQGIGTCHYMKGRKKEALKYFEKALKANPNSVQLKAFVEQLRRQVAAAPGS
jgi:tetratricopeptide (TPR) repeat protein